MQTDEYTREDELDENQNDEGNQDESRENQNQSHDEDDTDWKAEALKFKAILDRNKSKKVEKTPSKQSEGTDYGLKAFLVASGLKGEQEHKLAQDFARNTGKSIEDVVDSKYFLQELEDFRELRNTENASIKGRGKTSNSSASDVDYWLSKPFGELPDDFELRKKVVRARRDKSRSTGMFTKD
jgi:hypothetical protein